MKNVLQTKACISRQHFAALFASALLAVAITATPIAAVAQTSDSAAAKQNLNSAGEQFNLGGLKGVHSNQKERMPPPGWNYSNCGGKCEDYDTDDGYYLGGTESEEAPGQTLAVSFKPTSPEVLEVVITPNACWAPFLCNHQIKAKIFKDCSGQPCLTVLRDLTQVTAAIPTWPSSAPITYKVVPPLTLITGHTYWLCEEIKPSDLTGTALWMMSNSDTSPSFSVNTAGSCTTTGWISAGAGTIRPAFALY
jgi:hypothetical protein